MPVTKMSRSCRICLAQNRKLVPGATNTAAFGHRLSLSTKGASEKCRHLTGGGAALLHSGHVRSPDRSRLWPRIARSPFGGNRIEAAVQTTALSTRTPSTERDVSTCLRSERRPELTASDLLQRAASAEIAHVERLRREVGVALHGFEALGLRDCGIVPDGLRHDGLLRLGAGGARLWSPGHPRRHA